MSEPVAGIKNAGLAAVLSAVVPGLGQIYNGQLGKGILIILSWGVVVSVGAFIVLGLATLLMFSHLLLGILVYLVFFAACIVWWVWGIRDAYRTAKATST